MAIAGITRFAGPSAPAATERLIAFVLERLRPRSPSHPGGHPGTATGFKADHGTSHERKQPRFDQPPLKPCRQGDPLRLGRAFEEASSYRGHGALSTHGSAATPPAKPRASRNGIDAALPWTVTIKVPMVHNRRIPPIFSIAVSIDREAADRPLSTFLISVEQGNE